MTNTINKMDLDAFVDAFFDGFETPAKKEVEVASSTTAAPQEPKKEAPLREFRLPTGQVVKGYCATYSGRGELLEVDGKPVTMTAEERKKAKRGGGRKGGGARQDAGRDFIAEMVVAALETPLAKTKLGYEKAFKHSKEGMVYRCEEADYGIRVSKSKEAKFDVTEEGFEAEVSYVTRGKVKHQGGTIARLVVTHAGKAETKDSVVIADVKASGVVVHYAGAEYTVKIAKKRERVGFEGERADAF